MTIDATILAEGSGGEGFIYLIVVLVAGAIAFAKWIMRKLGEAEDEKQRQESDHRKAAGMRRDQLAQQREQQTQPDAREAMANAALRSMGIDVEEPEPPQPPPPPRRQQRQEPERMPLPQAKQSTPKAKPAPKPLPVAPPMKRLVDLSDRDSVRKAMIYHEIFSPPKALRDEQEL